MRFKRPQVRYADTPQPATPYQAAGQVWDERIGSPRVQAKNWRLMAFGCLTLALLMAGGLVWRSAQSIVTPYVVEVDNAGQVRAVGEAATPYRPNDAQTAHHIARFIGLVRSLSIDPIVVRQSWLDAYDYTTDRGAAVLNDYARTNDPFARIDTVGVGKLVQTAVELGQRTRPDIKLGICGEHGGDPSSIEFCHNVGLNYVSCSPFRVPIARLAAAQSALKSDVHHG